MKGRSGRKESGIRAWSIDQRIPFPWPIFSQVLSVNEFSPEREYQPVRLAGRGKLPVVKQNPTLRGGVLLTCMGSVDLVSLTSAA